MLFTVFNCVRNHVKYRFCNAMEQCILSRHSHIWYCVYCAQNIKKNIQLLEALAPPPESKPPLGKRNASSWGFLCSSTLYLAETFGIKLSSAWWQSVLRTSRYSDICLQGSSFVRLTKIYSAIGFLIQRNICANDQGGKNSNFARVCSINTADIMVYRLKGLRKHPVRTHISWWFSLF